MGLKVVVSINQLRDGDEAQNFSESEQLSVQTLHGMWGCTGLMICTKLFKMLLNDEVGVKVSMGAIKTGKL